MSRQILTHLKTPAFGRSLRTITFCILLLMPIIGVAMRSETQGRDTSVKQDVFETPTETPTFDPFAPTATFDPFAPPTTDAFAPTTDPFFQETPFNPEFTPEPTPFPTSTPVIEPETNLLLDAVKDMNLLADAVLGGGVRPEGWNGSQDPFNPELAVVTRSDLETLASEFINPNERPRSWIGAVGSTPFAIARDVRHDVELLADLVYGPTTRPEIWTGGNPLMRCNRSTQTLIALLERGGVFKLEIDPNDPEFCRNAELSVTQFTDEEILANTGLTELFTDQVAILSPNQVNSDIAIAFLDSAATRNVGTIPNGTPIQVLGKSNASFSRMMLVSGDGFQVYVDYQSTTVTEQQFANLPNATSLNLTTNCFATWCKSS